MRITILIKVFSFLTLIVLGSQVQSTTKKLKGELLSILVEI